MAGSMMNKRTANEEIPLRHYSHAIAKTMCNSSLPSCHLGDCTECPGKEPLREMLERYFNEEEIEEIEFKQWTTTDHSTLQTIVQSTDEFIENFLDKLETLRRHDFNAKQQSRYLAERKESLKEGEFLVIGDFSETSGTFPLLSKMRPSRSIGTMVWLLCIFLCIMTKMKGKFVMETLS